MAELAADLGHHPTDPRKDYGPGGLQGRDDNTGTFTPDQLFTRLGDTTGVLKP